MSARARVVLGSVLVMAVASVSRAADVVATEAQSYRTAGQPVLPQPNGALLCEAEEFQVEQAGWKPLRWGSNYYCASFANAFLSRKAFLSAPEQTGRSSAQINVQVPAAGRYLVLARYEAPYRFSAEFRVQVHQNGQPKLDRLYGARQNPKIWAFSKGLQPEVAWTWGAAENIVWEGTDAFADLQPGAATITLIADKQPEPAGRRNVDLIMLTRDIEDVKQRIAKEGYLPLDGLLTQSGDVYLKLHNRGAQPITLKIPNGTEHSPYWIHQRTWQPQTLTVGAGKSSEWTEVGSLLDSLNDGEWDLTVSPEVGLNYQVEIGVSAHGAPIQTVRTFNGNQSALTLGYFADTRYSKKIRLADEALFELLDYLKRHPVRGKAPERTLVYAGIFDRHPADPVYTTARNEFKTLTGIVEPDLTEPMRGSVPAGYIDIRTEKLDDEQFRQWQASGISDKIVTVSLGDEIGLEAPSANANEEFHAWLKTQKLRPEDIEAGAGDDWSKIVLVDRSAAKARPGLFYQSERFRHHYGILKQKEITDRLRQHLPKALFGANYSPHHGHHYLGEVHMWVSMFRQRGMTMPWSEDYIWQVPVGTHQMNSICVDLLRAGIRNMPESKIHFYVMAHAPGNTPDAWRRQFYGDIAHGTKIFNLFEFRPLQCAYTENYVDAPENYLAVRTGLYELGTFEDIVQDGRVAPGLAGLWFSEAADIWDDNRDPFTAAKRNLYIAIRHAQLPLDMVVEDDATNGDLAGYKMIYLADQHVSRTATKHLVDWVNAGGRLFATAGAGMFDELDQPNTEMRKLLGVEQQTLEAPESAKIVFEKQDLPFAEPLDHVNFGSPTTDARAPMPVFGAVSRITASSAKVLLTFRAGGPAMLERQAGQGRVIYCAFLPGLSYFKPAIPKRPVDRGSTRDSMAHFIPTAFDQTAGQLVASLAKDVSRPVHCSNTLIESTVIESPHGIAIPLINWTPQPIKGLRVTVTRSLPSGNASLASGRSIKASRDGDKQVFELDLDVADAIIVRK